MRAFPPAIANMTAAVRAVHAIPVGLCLAWYPVASTTTDCTVT